MDWFLYDRDFRYETAKEIMQKESQKLSRKMTSLSDHHVIICLELFETSIINMNPYFNMGKERKN